uniref:Uncharacterized protein n=1 Tax=Tanacetum cinerariifolium TaxID=118510 RepID=A0A699QR87_TANCI|nr:hypothetical protein [Tanacetum cinerariifolium]
MILPPLYWLDSHPSIIDCCLLTRVGRCSKLDHLLFEKSGPQVQSQLMKYHLLDKRLTDLVMMILVRQIEDYEMLLHMVTTDMKLLVVEIEIDDIMADDVDKVSCSTDVEKSKQVDLKFAHASIELHLHDIHVVQDKHEVDQRW